MSRRTDVVGGTVDAPIWPFPTGPSSGVGPATNDDKKPHMTDWPLRSFFELGSLPTAISCARLHAKHVLWEWGLHELIDDTELVVSELMTNALEASVVLPDAPPIALELLANSQSLVIQAWDMSPDDPAQYQPDYESEHGRGLLVVQALANRWGVERTGYRRKVVWCELNIAPEFLA